MTKVSKAVVTCVVTNAVGLAAYLFFSWRLWAGEPDGKIQSGDGAVAISWLFTAFPFMVIAALVDLVLFALAIRVFITQKRWDLALALGLADCAWALGVMFDQRHVVG
jgi:hypothetical protein